MTPFAENERKTPSFNKPSSEFQDESQVNKQLEEQSRNKFQNILAAKIDSFDRPMTRSFRQSLDFENLQAQSDFCFSKNSREIQGLSNDNPASPEFGKTGPIPFANDTSRPEEAKTDKKIAKDTKKAPSKSSAKPKRRSAKA